MNDTLKALVEAADKATPGPWKTEFNEKHGLSEYDVFSNTPHYQFVACHPSRISNPIAANMQFIVAARNAIPALRASLARDAALEQYIAELRIVASSGMGRTHSEAATASRLEQIMKREK